jgi:hypothetical protein
MENEFSRTVSFKGKTGTTKPISCLDEDGNPVDWWIIYKLPRYTAKNQYRKLETNIPRKGIARPQSQCPHSCVCERFIYSHDGSAYSAAGNMWTDPGHAIPRKGMHCKEISIYVFPVK